MAQFGYRHIKKMTPRPGRSYATEYYQQGREEQARCQAWVAATAQMITDRADETADGWITIQQPLRGFRRRESTGCYTALDIITDLLQQMVEGRDIPSGMLGRWNRLFADTDRTIEMVPEAELDLTNPNYNLLFGDRNE